MEFVLKPFQEAQKALEGEHYVNISFLPIVISEMIDQLGICEAAASQNTQQELIALVADMWQDFHQRWGDTITYSTNIIRSQRRCQKGIPTYAFWALALNLRTKRKVTTVLWEIGVTTMWSDITDAIQQIIQVEETEITAQQQHDEEEEEVEVEEPTHKKNIIS
jgi:hypothetical protein